MNIKEELLKLTKDERLDILYQFCSHCGRYEEDDIKCQCWNDE